MAALLGRLDGKSGVGELARDAGVSESELADVLAELEEAAIVDDAGCLNCQESHWREEWDSLVVLRRSAQVRAPSSTYGPVCGVVGRWRPAR